MQRCFKQENIEKVLETSLDDERRVVRKFASYAINIWSMINWIIDKIELIYYNIHCKYYNG